jgi:hypothetical protein
LRFALFKRWPRFEIDRIESEVTAGLTITNREGYVKIAEPCQLVALLIKAEFLLFNLSLLILGGLKAMMSGVIL